MSDVRDEVVNDRGIIKRIQLIFPGYHGYRVNEDLRDADIILKDELYKNMLDVINQLKFAESDLVRNGIFVDLDLIGESRSKIQTAAEKVKHHTGGYSGISAPVKVDAQKISSLYDLDMKIFDQIKNLSNSVNLLLQGCSTGSFDKEKLKDINSAVSSIQDINESREKMLYGGV